MGCRSQIQADPVEAPSGSGEASRSPTIARGPVAASDAPAPNPVRAGNPGSSLLSTMAASLVLAATFAQAEVGAYSTLSTPETVRWFTSFATIRETDEPGAVAEVLFHNVAVNGFYDQGYSEITLDGLTVGVRFIFNADQSGADRIVITPPDGFMAVPDTLTVPEGADGLALIYPAGPMS